MITAEYWMEGINKVLDRVVHSGPPLRNLTEKLDDMLDEQYSNNT